MTARKDPVVRHYGKRGRDASTACGVSLERKAYASAPSVSIDLRRITCQDCLRAIAARVASASAG